MTGERHRFASLGWLDALAGIYAALASHPGLAGANYSMCEVFTDVPESVNPDKRVAWHICVTDGVLTWAEGELAQPDYKVIADWATVEPLAKLVPLTDPDVARHAAEGMAKAAEAGLIRVEGSRERRPACLADVHDAIAALTA